MQEHCRDGATTFSARNLALFHAPCYTAYRQLELCVVSCPRALGRIAEAWYPVGEMLEPQGFLQRALPSTVPLA